MKNVRLFICISVILMIVLSVLSCSEKDQNKVLKNKEKIINKTELKGSEEGQISKTRCTNCHKTDENGQLVFKYINGKLDLIKKIEN